MDPIRETLLRDIDSFLAAHGMSASKFGRLAVGDHKLISRIRIRPTTSTTISRIRDFMASYARVPGDGESSSIRSCVSLV